ncbi:MAG: basic amino acid ABC transporter substrate-binding protein [Caldisericia bacterium]|jgi:polar amino acid transport system substrate-binding protein|nr:basic amino acid ABC transporter substrate-binding protein [Caldisericia bacterium]
MNKNKIILSVLILLLGFTFLVSCKKEPKVLNVGTSADYPPFEYVDEKTGEFVGFDLDLIRLLGKKLGYEVKIVNMDFDSIIPALEKKKIDVAIACITITEDRLKVAPAIPYWDTGQSIIVNAKSDFRPKSLGDLSNKKVGVQKGTTGEQILDEGIEKKEVINVDVRRYTSVILGMLDLQNGVIDAMIIDTPVAKLYEQKYNYVVTTELAPETAGIFVQKDNEKLFNDLKKALEEVKNSKDWQDLIQKYFSGE